LYISEMWQWSKLAIPRSLSAWTLLTLMVLVGVLARLQYGWIDRIAAAERKSNQQKLDAGLKALGDDFDTEITRVHMAFAFVHASSIEEAEARAGDRLRLFRELSLFPGVVSTVLVDHGIAGADSIERGPPPVVLVPLNLVSPVRLPVPPHIPPPNGGRVPVAPSINLPPGLPRRPAIPFSRFRVVLDDSYIRNVLLARLLERYLGPGAEHNYEVFVRAAGVDDDARTPAAGRSVQWEATRRIFAVRLDCLLRLPSESDTAAAVQRPVETSRFLRQTGNCAPETRSSGIWWIGLRGRSSTLAEASDSARRRSLAISLGVMLVLAAGIAVLFVAADRAREFAALQEQFAASVSHELRTPLAVISSASQNIGDGVVENAAQMRQYGTMIQSHTRQLTEMIENALWFARRNPKGEIQRTEVNVAELVEAVAAMCSPTLREAGVSLECEIEPGMPPLYGNRSLLLQALQNLLINVARHGRSGKWARVRVEQEHGNVVFTVDDRGDGIASGELDRVCEPFYRGRRAKQTNTSGLGLGLSLVHQIAEAHFGNVQLRSNAGRGTTVRVTLPLKPKE
jgi:signal transduction histidine kinase